jgi:hypothetical protein
MDRERDRGLYVEPNDWMVHRARSAITCGVATGRLRAWSAKP